MEHYFEPQIECASREQITAWQDERLVKTVKRVYEASWRILKALRISISCLF